MSITLDKRTHRYTIDGRAAPGIHDILEAAGLLNDMVADDYYLERGQRVHTAIEYDIKWEGDLYVEDLPEDERGYVYAARKAREELKLFIRPNDVEMLACNRELWYASQIDAYATDPNCPYVINWKTGGFLAWYKIQSAAEAMCFTKPYPLRLTICLNQDGTYWKSLRGEQEDFEVWKACCEIYNWKMKQGGGVRPRQAKPEEPETEPVADSKLFDLPDQPKEPEGIF